MDIYLVGGAVRDRLLGLPVRERDWVVVGATPQRMIDDGFRAVGKDFPVFLHPETSEEYALARTERKTEPGHGGFVFHAREDVSLEEDLVRRDLTINAIAEAADGTLIDPCGGRRDLEQRVLRHVSDAFVEDPLRVLRVARFAARFAHLDFTVADSTQALMRTISASGELETLSAERIWQEYARALRSDAPSVFLQVLNDVGALAALFDELARSIGEPAAQGVSGSIDGAATAVKDLRAVPAIASLDLPAPEDDVVEVRHAALVAGALASRAASRHTVTLDEAAGERARGLAERLRAPGAARDASIALARGRRALFLLPGTTAGVLLDAALAADAARRPERFATVRRAVDRLLVAEGADGAHRGRVRRVLAALPEALAVDARAWAKDGRPGSEIGALVRSARLERVGRLLAET